jgi:hypothetical protein
MKDSISCVVLYVLQLGRVDTSCFSYGEMSVKSNFCVSGELRERILTPLIQSILFLGIRSHPSSHIQPFQII